MNNPPGKQLNNYAKLNWLIELAGSDLFIEMDR